MRVTDAALSIVSITAVLSRASASGDQGLVLSLESAAQSEDHLLFYDLFLHYNKHVRPTPKWGLYQTDVFFEISLFDILFLELKSQRLRTNTEMIMKWLDSGLKWNPANYSGVHSI
ncbi:unnamed protein product, partial [Meganyctiphanes norvegica]